MERIGATKYDGRTTPGRRDSDAGAGTAIHVAAHGLRRGSK